MLYLSYSSESKVFFSHNVRTGSRASKMNATGASVELQRIRPVLAKLACYSRMSLIPDPVPPQCLETQWQLGQIFEFLPHIW